MSTTIEEDRQPFTPAPPPRWQNKRYFSSFTARRPAQLVGLLAFMAVAGVLVSVLASGPESNNVPVCNPPTQVNTVCNSQNDLTLAQTSSDWWHSSGTQILDSSGNPVYLRGVDDGRMVPASPTVPAATEFSNLSSWGFNFIRLGISWANLEPATPTANTDGSLNHTWSQTYLSQIDSAIQQADANHLRIVLDFHQVSWSPKFGGTGMPSWLFPTATQVSTAKCEFMANTTESGVPESQQAGLIAAEQMIATHYLSDPTVVGIDMFNEPQACNGSYTPNGTTPYDDFYHNAGTAIHQINPNLLLIYEDDAYQSYLSKGFALTRPLDVPNAVYSTHMYPDAWNSGNSNSPCSEPNTAVTGLQNYQAHLARAQSWGQPFYIGEFDGFHLSHNPCTPLASASQDTLSMMSQALADNVNWSLWEYSRTGDSLINNSTGAAKQPLLADLQSGITQGTGTGSAAPTSGSVTLCQAGSANFNSWNSLAVNAAVPADTTVSVKFATASGSCTTPSGESAFSDPVMISDSGTAGATDPHLLSSLNLANTKILLMEVDLSTTDASATPTVNSITLTDTPVNAPPSVPAGLKATPSYTSAALSWTASTDDNDPQTALTYKVYRGGTFLVQTQAGATSYTDSTLTPGTTYSYTVAACDSQAACSNQSTPLAVTTPKQDTTPPSVPTFKGSTTTKNSATVVWNASTDNVTPQSQLTYRVYNGSTLLGTTKAVIFTQTGLSSGTKYTYYISACDVASNCSAKSSGRTVTTVKAK